MKEKINTPNMNMALWLAVMVLVLTLIVPVLHSNPGLFKDIPPDQTQAKLVYPPPMPEKLVIKQDRVIQIPETKPILLTAQKAERLYHPYITKVSNRYRVDPAMVHAIIMAESSYNPKAVSKAGARGLMQLMPITAKEMGVVDSFNPKHNIEGGVRYYKKLLKQFNGDTKLALAAYNAGSKHVLDYNGIPPFKATQYYVKKVLEYYQYYKKRFNVKKV